MNPKHKHGDDFFIELENKLLTQSVRCSTTELAQLLSDDFIEFSASGGIYNKQQTIEALSAETEIKSPIIKADNFCVHYLSEKVVLITYRSIKVSPTSTAKKYALRSSIWHNNELCWQMRFHQGTPTK